MQVTTKSLYGGLLQGMLASQALCQAMQVVQGTKQFSHPSNWAGFILVGGDTALTNKEALMSSAISKLLDNPVNCRDALKVLVHLVCYTIPCCVVCVCVRFLFPKRPRTMHLFYTRFCRVCFEDFVKRRKKIHFLCVL